MPEYIYSCAKEDGGCGDSFSLIMSVSQVDDNNRPKCPKCKKNSAVHRDFKEENSHADAGPSTIGMLMDKNTDKLSTDEKLAIFNRTRNEEKHRTQLKDEPTTPIVDRI